MQLPSLRHSAVALSVLVGLAAVPAVALRTQTTNTTVTAPVMTAGPSPAPPIRHVFVIVLENESRSVAFGPHSPAPYLARTLRSQGAYLPAYHGIGHDSLDNYVAMISGQPPNPMTSADCPRLTSVSPTGTGRYGAARGTGCVYSASVGTIASQLSAQGLTWKGYMDSMGADPRRESATCAHPRIGASDNTEVQTARDQYATRHDPFVYFHSIIDNRISCDRHVVNLQRLPHDLLEPSTTPNYAFITPGLCNDGHDVNCPNGDLGGLRQINTFLRTWVPRITRSPAFRRNGLLIITFDEAAPSDASACCGEIPGPAEAKPGLTGPGGGDTGAVLLSPFIRPGTVSHIPYDHYAMLGSVENLFGLRHLAYAALPHISYFGSDVYTRSRAHAPGLGGQDLGDRAGRRRRTHGRGRPQ